MASLHFIAISLVLLVGSTSATWGRSSTTLPEGAQLGDTCTPSRSPLRCGERTLLGSTERELNATDGFEGYSMCYVLCTMPVQALYGGHLHAEYSTQAFK